MCRTVTVTLIVWIMLEISRAASGPCAEVRCARSGPALVIRPADEGASLRELLDRMGHTSTRATLIYLHSFDERQRKLADAAGERARAALGKTGIASGAELTRSPGQMP